MKGGIKGELPEKGWVGQFANLRGVGLAKKRGVVFFLKGG